MQSDHYGINWCQNGTSLAWKTGMNLQKMKNSMYLDGHEMSDVREYRKAFVEYWMEHEKQFYQWDQNRTELPCPNGFSVLRAIGCFCLILVTYNKSTFFQNNKFNFYALWPISVSCIHLLFCSTPIYTTSPPYCLYWTYQLLPRSWFLTAMFYYSTSVQYTWPLPPLGRSLSHIFPDFLLQLIPTDSCTHELISYKFFCYLLSTILRTYLAISMANWSIHTFLWPQS